MNNSLLAEMFSKLPFAFSDDKSIKVYALQIIAGNFANVVELLRAEISCHQDCDNWIKADVMAGFLKKVK